MAETKKGSRLPGDDQPVGSGEAGQLTLLTAMRACKKEAFDARRTRLMRNRENRRAYLGLQDWSHKVKGQSKEFLPKTPLAVEQFVAFAKRALTQFGAYYEIELGRDSRSPISGTSMRSILDSFLNRLMVEDNVESSFPVLISNALKVGALESLIILKVHGARVPVRHYIAETDETGYDRLSARESYEWRLRIDLIPPEHYFPDPTGAGLYEIHSAKRDLSYVTKRAEEGIYDKAAVARIKEDFNREELEVERRAIDRGQDDAEKPGFRKKVVIDEFWGDVVDNEGKVVHKNCFFAVANDKYVIRKPKPNPFWHQESPFVVVPLIRVPFSVWHKAIFDHASQVNFALNELYNLIIDGGISSVWGIKQLRIDDLDDPKQAADGIPQGETLLVKSTLPHGAKVLETVTEGEVPRDAMSVFEMLSREFAAASMSNELKMGSMPPKQVKATEVVELSQSQAVTMDGVVSDVERDLISKTLKKAWFTILQNMNDVSSDEMINAIGLKSAYILSRMSPAQRYAAMGGKPDFKVFGLSQVMARVRDFQKMMALLQAVSSMPVLLQAFFTRYSPQRVLSHLIKMLGINPEQMRRDDDELQSLSQELQQLPFFQGLAGSPKGTTQRGSGVSAQTTGEPGLPAEIASAGNPTAGLAGAGGA